MDIMLTQAKTANAANSGTTVYGLGVASDSREGLSSIFPRVVNLADRVRSGSWNLRKSMGLYEEKPTSSAPQEPPPSTPYSALAYLERLLTEADINLDSLNQHINS